MRFQHSEISIPTRQGPFYFCEISKCENLKFSKLPFFHFSLCNIVYILFYPKVKMTEEKFIVNILFLCDDLLINILKYAGYRHRSQSAVLTCKKFYSLCCEIDKFKFPLKLNNEIVSNKEKDN